MRINKTISLILILLATCLSFYAQQDGTKGVTVQPVVKLPGKEKRWALIIGIDKYEKDVSSLYGAVNDAKALKNILVNFAGFPENQIILLTTDAADPDALPKRENILDALNKLYQIPEDGLLLFSFSGHGVSVGDKAYLIPSNGRITKNLSLLRDFSIDVERIKEAIKEIRVKQVLMLLDACRNEPGKGDIPNQLTEAYKKGFSFDVANKEVEAFATLYATSIGSRAFEFYDDESKQYRGYFSYAVEEAMKGKAANENGEVTLSRMISYVENTVPQKVLREKGERQIPSKEIAGYKESELVLSLLQSKPQPTPNTYSPNTYSAASGDKLFWLEIEKRGTIDDYKSYLARYPDGEFSAVARLRLANLKWLNFKEKADSLLKYDEIEDFSEELAAAKLKSKSGFIDRNAREVIPLKYDFVMAFSEGVAWINFSGLVDKNGKETPTQKFNSFTSFSDGLAQVGFEDKVGFVDKTGKTVIPFKYGEAGYFSEERAWVELNGKYGFIDKTGKIVIPIIYDDITPFSEGLAFVKNAGFSGFINTAGKRVFPLKLDSFSFFSDGIGAACLREKCGFIDKKGKTIISFIYDSATGFSEGLAKVSLNGKKGFIDKKGTKVTPIKYDVVEDECEQCLEDFFDGMAMVSLNGKYGFVNTSGVEIVSPKYDLASPFNEGFAKVAIGTSPNLKYGFIDTTGKEVVPPKYDNIWCEAFLNEGFAGVVLNQKKGFVDIYGNEYFNFETKTN